MGKMSLLLSVIDKGQQRVFFSVNPFRFIWLNFFSRKIKRDKGKYIIPLYGTRLELHKGATIHLHAHLGLNFNKYPHSRAECYLRLRKNATLNITGQCMMFYNSTVEVHEDAVLNLGSRIVQSGAVVICGYKMTIGNDCVMARMSSIFDSDFHCVYDDEGNILNMPKETIIGDNVWLGVKATVLRGSQIEHGSAVGANGLVSGEVKEHTLMINEKAREHGKINWSTERSPKL